MKHFSFRKLWFKKIGQTSFLFSLLTSAAVAQNADFMSGKWGVGFRISANQKTTVARYNVDNLVNQMKEIGANHVVLNLSQAANGDVYLAPHSVLGGLATSSINQRDLFGELAAAFDEAGIDVIAYMASEGPAKLKHGVGRAHDARTVNGVTTSAFMDKWAEYVQNRYGNTTSATYKRAYAEVVVEEFAERYGDLVDGWWFDHATHCNKQLVVQAIRKHNPDAAIALNDGQKVPLINNHPGLEDFTAGHVNPVASTIPSSNANLPMVTSIEGTANGYFSRNGSESLGHVFMPLAERWNVGDIVWTQEQAEDWASRTVGSQGSWTWNVATNDGGSGINSQALAFLRTFSENVPNPTGPASFMPDQSKVYHIENPTHGLRLAATGNSEDAYTTSLSVNSADTRWKFVQSSTNGLWHIERAAGGSTPRLRTDETVNPDMQANSNVGVNTQFSITESPEVDGTYLFTVPTSNTSLQRFRILSNGSLDFATNNNEGINPSLRIVEASAEKIVRIEKRNAQTYALHCNESANGGNVNLHNNQTHSNLQWVEIDRGNGFYSYQRVNSTHSIDGRNGGENSQNVHVWTTNSSNYNQHWQKVSAGGGAYQLRKRNATGFCINGGGSGANLQNVTLWNSSSTSQNLQWFVVEQ